MQYPTIFLSLPLGLCLCVVLTPGAHRAWGQTPANYLATYEFNAYYADQIEASPSDIDVSPHQLTEADDVTAGNRKPAREAPNSRLPWKRYRLTNGRNSCCRDFGWYANVQLNFLSTNLTSKIDTPTSSGQLELSPRIVAGYLNYNQYGTRVRYQHYGWHTNSTTTPSPSRVQFELDSVDLEATKRLLGCHTNLDLAVGVRLAKVQESGLQAESDANLIGGTFAADARTQLCCKTCWSWSWVYGGRLSLLDGHWNGTAHQGNGTVFVSEVYTGIEYRYCRYRRDLFVRFLFEAQNWHSDAFLLSDNVTLMGPGVQFGVGF